MAYIWAAALFGLTLITFDLKYVPGNIFVNTVLASGSDIPAFIASGFIYKKFGVRFAFILFFSISVTGAVCLIVAHNLSTATNALFVMLARVGISTTMGICYLANADLFPAVLAGTVYGICNVGARLIQTTAPLIAELPDPVPIIVFTSTTALAVTASTMLSKQ